jgi:hypothetical protein
MILCAGGFAWVKEKFVAGVPGQTFVMQAGKLKAIEPSTAFLAAAPRDTWPSRARNAGGEPPDYTPATGRRELADDELARLAAQLTDLAGSLVGGPLFKGLFSLLTTELVDRKPTFAFVARAGEHHHVFEYVATQCGFVPAHTDGANPRTAYLAGLECWASDLLAVLDGALGPIALTYGRARLWNALPQRFHFDIFEELYRVSHPLRRPAEYARTYQRAWQAVAATVPTIAAAAP